MPTVNVNTNEPYNIYLFEHLKDELEAIKKSCHTIAKHAVIICDQAIAKTYAQHVYDSLKKSMPCDFIEFNATEENKARETKQQFEDKLIELNCKRDSCLIAIGGGITTDFVGFLAATYYRGIPVIYIPTTLLAMVDASIGGKTGVNTSYGKNLIGAFKQPHAVFIAADTLNSLPEKQMQEGIAECIKHALIADASLWSLLQDNRDKILNKDLNTLMDLITKNIQIKKSIVEKDEREKSLRKVLNFGHTYAHALEQASKHKVTHGEAVALGMLKAIEVSINKKLCDPALLKQVERLLAAYHLPTRLNINIDQSRLREALHQDKKNTQSTIQMVLIEDIGKIAMQNTQHTETVSLAEVSN
jgi:3-dehydroquinate synthase